MKKIIAAIMMFSLLFVFCACSQQRAVRTVRVNENGELVVIFTDGSESVVGTVKGEKGDPGTDGINGTDGKDGRDGVDGKPGETGKTGLMGPEGKNGRAVKSITSDGNGGLLVTYEDDKTETIDLLGQLYLFGGKCGENAAWGLFNGGILVISGEGSTYDYEEGATPWYSVIPMIAAVYVDRSDGLIEGKNLFFGIDESIVLRSEATSKKWVDMTDYAPIYSEADNTGEPVTKLYLGTELHVVSEADGYTEIVYNGAYAYIETKYTVDNDGSVVYEPAAFQLKVIRDTGANVRTFPDATSNSGNNTYANIPAGSILNCTGVSKNGTWYRISYEGHVLYAYMTWVERI